MKKEGERKRERKREEKGEEVQITFFRSILFFMSLANARKA